jgi:glycosyltransferase-like protein
MSHGPQLPTQVPESRDAAPALRIALLTHSTNPRGGVVHAVELGDALYSLGHHVTIHAPDPQRAGLFRQTICSFEPVPAAAGDGNLVSLVQQRIDEYVAWFVRWDTPRFDVYHAQDSISANALATLVERGVIPGFVRTVHHLDNFTDPQLIEWQTHGFMCADQILCVSRLWQDRLLEDYGVRATVVGNGVNTMRFSPLADAHDKKLRVKLGLGGGPIFLAVGGVEPRKNSVAILQAFARVLHEFPDAQLVIAGGVSLLDHSDYHRQFANALAASAISTGAGKRLILVDKVDDHDMPALFRCADALVFPSLREGFGLVVLEAMACGTPAVVSRIAPFTEYLGNDTCLWVDPLDPASIAAGMAQACDPGVAGALRQAGLAASKEFSWTESAARHLGIYRAQAALALEKSHA